MQDKTENVNPIQLLFWIRAKILWNSFQNCWLHDREFRKLYNQTVSEKRESEKKLIF